MADPYLITAQLNLRSPTVENMKKIRDDISDKLSGKTAGVKVGLLRPNKAMLNKFAKSVQSDIGSLLIDTRLAVPSQIELNKFTKDVSAKLAPINIKFSAIQPVGNRILTGFDKLYSKITDINTGLSAVSTNAKSATLSLQAMANSVKGSAQSLRSLPKQINLGGGASRGRGGGGGAKTPRVAAGPTESPSELFAHQAGLATRRFLAFSAPVSAIFGFIRATQEGISQSIQFERELIRVAQATGKPVSGLSDLTKEVRRLSAAYGTSSLELIGVAKTLSQAGFNADETRIALNALAKTELTPTFEKLSSTVEGSIAVLNQFKGKVQDLEPILSKINVLSAAYAAESQDYVVAIQKAGSTWSSAGGKLEELLATFTTVRQTTRESADTIATAFRTIFARIQRPETIKFLRQFNVELAEAGKFVGPFEAIQRIAAVVSKYPQGSLTRASILEEVGGIRQLSKVTPLIENAALSQEALAKAQSADLSLTKDTIIAQQALAVQLQKTREKFLEFMDTLFNSSGFKAVVSSILAVTNALTSMGKAIGILAPALAVLAAFKVLPSLVPKGGTFLRTLAGAGSMKGNIAASIPATGFARGGSIPGVGNGDTVPIMATPGEFILNKGAASRIGHGTLNKINKGVQYFAGGGTVMNMAELAKYSAHRPRPWYAGDEYGIRPIGTRAPRHRNDVSIFHPGQPYGIGARITGAGYNLRPIQSPITNVNRSVIDWQPEQDDILNEAIDKRLASGVSMSQHASIYGPQPRSFSRTEIIKNRFANSYSNIRNGFVNNRGRIFKGIGGVAALATTYGASQLGGREGAKVQGALQGGFLGAAVGAQFGPWGIAIGGAIGALHGFVSSLKEFDKQIQDANNAKVFESLTKKTNEIVGNLDNMGIVEGRTAVSQHLSKIDVEAFRVASQAREGQNTFFNRIRGVAGERGQKAADEVYATYGLQAFDLSKAALGREVQLGLHGNAQSLLGTEVGQRGAAYLKASLQTKASDLKQQLLNVNPENTTEASSLTTQLTEIYQQLGSFTGPGGAAALYKALSGFDEATGKYFATLKVSLNEAADYVIKLNTHTNAILGATFNRASMANARSGGLTDYSSQINFGNANLGGLLAALPLGDNGALAQSAHDYNRFAAALAGEAPISNREKLSDLARNTMSANSVSKFLELVPENHTWGNNFDLLGIFENMFKSQIEAARGHASARFGALQQTGNEADLYASLREAAFGNRLGGIGLRAGAGRFRAGIAARMRGVDATRLFTDNTFGETQAALAGGIGGNPAALGARLAGVNASLMQAQIKANAVDATDADVLAMKALQAESNQLTHALSNLTDAAQMSASAQERLADVNKTIAASLGFIGGYIGGGGGEQRKMENALRDFNRVRNGGSLENLSPARRQNVLGLDANLEVGGQRVGSVLENALLNSRSAQRLQGLGLNVGQAVGERNALEGQIGANFATAQDAMRQLQQVNTELANAMANSTSSLLQGFQQFDGSTKNFVDAVNALKQIDIQVNGNQAMNLNINGAEALTRMMGEIKDVVRAEIGDQLAMAFPEMGVRVRANARLPGNRTKDVEMIG